MQLSLAYLDASAIEEIPLAVWAELFESVGWPSSLEGEALTYDAIRASLQRDEPTEGLLLALEAAHGLGTGAGREALLEAMRDRHVGTGRIPDGCGEREFAVRMFILQRAEPLIADAFVRAQIQVQARGEHKSVNEFWGAEARVVRSVERSKVQLERLMRSHCEEHDLGPHVQVDALEDDSACVFQVIHSDRTRKPLAIVDGSSARSMIEYRPVHCDVIRYDAVSGRLQVAARRAALVNTYVRLVGEALFEDPTFFVGEAACTLTPLQEKGRVALGEHDLPGVGRVWMTECTWERGDRNIHRIRSHDCFEDIEALSLPIGTEGRLIEVKLKIQIAQQGTRPVTVSIRIPGKIRVSNTRFEPLVHEYLEHIGIRCRSASLAALDLWSLHPWRHPPATWRAVFGGQTEVLARAGALIPVDLESVQHPDLVGAGNALEVHEVGEGRYQGVAREPEFPSKSLSATDVEGFALDVEAFGMHLGERLELPERQVMQVGADVLDLGPVHLGGQTFRPFYVLNTPGVGIAARVRAGAAGENAVLLVPRGRAGVSDLPSAELSHPIPSRRTLERALVFACSLEGQVPAIHYAREGSRLVVDTRHGVIWVDRVEVGLKPDTHPFLFVELLARACPSPIPSVDLSRQLSPIRDDDTTAARHAKRDAKRAIIEALAAGGLEFQGDPFPSAGRGAYRCALPAEVH